MSIKRDTVFVIKSIDFAEADKILTLFGLNRGKFTVLAKGIRKIASKRRASMQTMTISEISYYQGRGMGILTESKLLVPADYSMQSIPNIERILFLLYKLLPEEQEEQLVFKKLLQLLKGDLVDSRSVNGFRLSYLKHAGFIPDYTSCTACHRKGELQYLNKDSFELFCQHCYNKESKKMQLHNVNNLDLTVILDKFINDLV